MSEWISVKDQLPDIGVDVLLFYKKDQTMLFVGYLGDDGSFHKKESYYVIDFWQYEILSWQPLPEPTNGESHE